MKSIPYLSILFLALVTGETCFAETQQERIQAACRAIGRDHHIDNSGDSLIEALTGGETFSEAWSNWNPVAGDIESEKDCLERRGVVRNGNILPQYRTTSQDVGRYYSDCSFIQTGFAQEAIDSLAEDVSEALTSENLVYRDSIANGAWQSLASRTHGHLMCRATSIETIRNSDAQLTRLIREAQPAFEDKLIELQELILAKQISDERSRAEIDEVYNADGQCDVGVGAIIGWDFCTKAAEGRAERYRAHYEREIVKLISTLPFGFEPDVVDAYLDMATSGNFDSEKYEQALGRAQGRYENMNSYYESRRVDINNNGNPYFCIEDSFKSTASEPLNANNINDFGMIGRLTENNQENGFLRESQKIILQCKMRQKYYNTNVSTDKSIELGLGLGGLATALVTTAVSRNAGSGFAAYAAVTSFGISAVTLAMQVDKAREACMKPDLAITTETPVCDARAELEAEIDKGSLSECFREIGWSAVAAIPIPFDVKAAVRVARANPNPVALSSLVDDVRNGAYRNYTIDGDQASQMIVVTARRRSGNAAADAPTPGPVRSGANAGSEAPPLRLQFTDDAGRTITRDIDPRALANSQLDDTQRTLALRERFPDRLTDDQIEAVLRNHNGTGDAAGFACDVGTCSPEQLRRKLDHLINQNGIDRNTAMAIIREGYAGNPNAAFRVADDGVFSVRPDNFSLSSMGRSPTRVVELADGHPNRLAVDALQDTPLASDRVLRVQVERTLPDGSTRNATLEARFRGTDSDGDMLYFENSDGITAINPNDPALRIRGIESVDSGVIGDYNGIRSLYESNPQRALASNRGHQVRIEYRDGPGEEVFDMQGEVVIENGRTRIRYADPVTPDRYDYVEIDDIGEITGIQRLTPERRRWEASSAHPRDLDENFRSGMQVDVTYQGRARGAFSDSELEVSGEFLGVNSDFGRTTIAVRNQDGEIIHIPMDPAAETVIQSRARPTDVFRINE